MKVIKLPSNEELAEPNWSKLLHDAAQRKTASRIWRAAIDEMRQAETLSTATLPKLERYAVSMATYEHAATVVAAEGPVTASPNGEPKYNPWWVVMKQADTMASYHEASLGLTPTRRSTATKALKQNTTKTGAADGFLTG